MASTVCLDFDGVCNTYDGWKGPEHLFDPREGLLEFVLALQEHGKRVAVFSTRPSVKLQDWFVEHFKDTARALIGTGDLFFPTEKPSADCYIDDRAIRFDGSFSDLLPYVLDFKTFWETKPTNGFGATGQFPEGKISRDDEGELRMGIAHDVRQQTVLVNFGKPVAWFGIPPSQARALAEMLMQHADLCEKRKG